MSLLNENWRQESIDKTHTLKLPLPSQDAIHHSEKVMQLILERIISNHGKISFGDYMQMALYEPGLGYYSAGNQKFGAQGDFVTAPELSPLFSYCIARECQTVLQNLSENNGTILELGAGSGKMAADILVYLDRNNALPQKYLILEISAELKLRQQQTLQKHCPGLLSHVEWINKLPNAFKGIILANEVCDAMPIHRVCFHNDQISELYVSLQNNNPVWITQPFLHKHTNNYFKNLFEQFNGRNNAYYSEINLALPAWIQSLSDSMHEGVVFIIDYGFPAQEYYHPDRSMGTLMCHYRHHSLDDPFFWPGLQDITSHVDFTLIADSAHHAHFDVLGYTNQASFLLGAGLLELDQSELLTHQTRNAIQTLTSPAEMGELFKVIALGKNFSSPLGGFTLRDQRYRL